MPIPQDAEKALDYDVDGIVVSNHGADHSQVLKAVLTFCLGGRQVDGAIPSIYALANITQSEKIKAEQASGKLTVLFDSGIRTGSDIIKAMALGAQGVLRESYFDLFSDVVGFTR